MEHQDQLARFGVERLHLRWLQGRPIVVIDDGETTDYLVDDLIEVRAGMCARLYGRRGARGRAIRAVTAAQRERGEHA